MEWLTLDIETRGGNPDSVEEWMRNHWRIEADWKPETIGKRYLEARDLKKQKMALMDSAGIAVVAMASQGGTLSLSHALRAAPLELLDYGTVMGFATEREMLEEVDGVIRQCADETTLLVGHNIRRFDLPRLRLAYVRAGLPMPPWLSTLQPTYDIMVEYCRGFSVERQELISFDDVMRGLGMVSHKGIISGADVERLIAEGNVEAIMRYASLDVQKETEAFLIMTGRSAASHIDSLRWMAQRGSV